MQPASSHPSRPSGGPAPLGVAPATHGLGGSLGAHAGFSATAVPTGGAGREDEAALHTQALDGALALVRADGGEIATIDAGGGVMISRARASRPRLSTARGGLGLSARPSQPLPDLAPGQGARNLGDLDAVRDALGQSAVRGPHAASDPIAADESGEPRGAVALPRDAGEIADQKTVVLPAALAPRAYRPGEGLIGQAWQRGEPVILRGEDYRAAVRHPIPPSGDAAWHLAVPIFRAGSLADVRPTNEVIGVIAVYIRDPLWSFSTRDVELLALHADRLARSLALAEAARRNDAMAALLDTLRDAGFGHADQSAAGGLPALYTRVRDLVRRAMDAPSFAFVVFHSGDERIATKDEITVELAEHAGHPLPPTRVLSDAFAPWWQHVRKSQDGRAVLLDAVGIGAPGHDGRVGYAPPEERLLGVGGDDPLGALVAAPLRAGSRLLGALVAASPRPGAYTYEHVREVEHIAAAAALVFDHARLFADMQLYTVRNRERAIQLAALNNAVLTLNSTLDLDTTLVALVKQALSLTGANACAALLEDEHGGEMLQARAANVRSGLPPVPLDLMRIPKAWHGLDRVLQEAAYMLYENLETQWSSPHDPSPWFTAERIRTLLVVPITRSDPQSGDEQTLGALVAYTPGERHHFAATEIGLLQGLASQAGIAIRNAALFAERERALEERERAYEELAELDRMKDDFILTVSHEFRTPLTTIDGYVTLLNRHAGHLDSVKLEQYGAEIRHASAQLADMITMLADANRLNTENISTHSIEVDVREVARRAIGLQTLEAKAQIALEIPPSTWVKGDPQRLALIFSNLLRNATKYAPNGTPYRVGADVVPREDLARMGMPHALADDAPPTWVVLTVQDYGPGIAPEDQAKLFKKFSRLAQSLTTPVRGTGLGLWICKQYVETMHGDIWVDSALGKGARFRFALPLAPAPASAPPAF